MRIVVTGSHGFIGKHLVAELRHAGHTVTGMDNRAADDQSAADPIHLRRVLQESRAEAIVHLAVAIDDNDIMRTVQGTIGMAAAVAEIAAENDVRMIISSTNEVYGTDRSIPLCTEYGGPWGLPSTTYGMVKRLAEQMCSFHAPQRLTILRFADIYGPGMRPAHSQLIDMLSRISRDKDIIASAHEMHAFCWIGDAVRAARLAIELGEGAYNIASDDWRAMDEVAVIAAKAMGRPVSIDTTSDMRRASSPKVSTERIRRLGWAPSVSLEEGIVTTVRSWPAKEMVTA